MPSRSLARRRLPRAEPRFDDRVTAADRLVVGVIAALGVLGVERRDRLAVIGLPRLDVRVEPPIEPAASMALRKPPGPRGSRTDGARRAPRGPEAQRGLRRLQMPSNHSQSRTSSRSSRPLPTRVPTVSPKASTVRTGSSPIAAVSGSKASSKSAPIEGPKSIIAPHLASSMIIFASSFVPAIRASSLDPVGESDRREARGEGACPRPSAAARRRTRTASGTLWPASATRNAPADRLRSARGRPAARRRR